MDEPPKIITTNCPAPNLALSSAADSQIDISVGEGKTLHPTFSADGPHTAPPKDGALGILEAMGPFNSELELCKQFLTTAKKGGTKRRNVGTELDGFLANPSVPGSKATGPKTRKVSRRKFFSRISSSSDESNDSYSSFHGSESSVASESSTVQHSSSKAVKDLKRGARSRSRRSLLESNDSDSYDNDGLVSDSSDAGSDFDELAGTIRRRKRRERVLFKQDKPRRKTAGQASEVSPEVADLMARASDMYLSRKIPEAITVLEEIIAKAPGLHDPFHLLGVIYEEELNDLYRARDCYLLAAQLIGDDYALWKRVGFLAKQLGDSKQAYYCFQRCVAAAKASGAPLDAEAAYELVGSYQNAYKFGKAAKILETLLKEHPGDVFLTRELAKNFHRAGKLDEAAAVLETAVSIEITPAEWEGLQGLPGVCYLPALPSSRQSSDPNTVMAYDLHVLNMLCEVYCETRRYRECALILARIIDEGNISKIPLELTVKFAISILHYPGVYAELNKESKEGMAHPSMDSKESIREPFIRQDDDRSRVGGIVLKVKKALEDKSVSRELFCDIYVAFADACLAGSRPKDALWAYTEVAAYKGEDASFWVKIAKSSLALQKTDAQQSLDPHSTTINTFQRLPDSTTKHALLNQGLDGPGSGVGEDMGSKMGGIVKSNYHGPDNSVLVSLESFKDNVAKPSVMLEPRRVLTHVMSKVRYQRHRQILLSMPADSVRTDSATSLLPPALSPSERRSRFISLQSRLRAIVPMCAGDNLAQLSPMDRQLVHEWIEDFILVVQDSELDVQRVTRYNFDNNLLASEIDPSVRKALLEELGKPSNDTEKADLLPGLDPGTVGNSRSIELDALAAPDPTNPMMEIKSNSKGMTKNTGDKNSGKPGKPLKGSQNSVSKGSRKDKPESGNGICGNFFTKAKTELQLVSLEDLLGWREFGFFIETGVGVVMRAAGQVLRGVQLIEVVLANRRLIRTQQFDLERRAFTARLKKLSLTLAIEAGLLRVALAYVRERYLRRPDCSDRTLDFFGRLLFCGSFSHAVVGGLSSSKHRHALLENRAWCVRQLVQRPHSFPLTLLTGHFCSLAGRWLRAIGEYSRAHRLLPKNEVAALALAVAYLNQSTSRNVDDRHAMVIRGFAALSHFCQCRDSFLATQKNDATNLLLRRIYEAEKHYNIGRAFHQINILDHAMLFYYRALRVLPPTTAVPKAFRVDVNQLRCCSACNLHQIFAKRGDKKLAAWFSKSACVWE